MADWRINLARRRSEMPATDAAPDADFKKALGISGCHYVFMNPFVDRTYPKSMYPIERLAATMNPVDYRYVADPTSPGKRIEFILAKYTP